MFSYIDKCFSSCDIESELHEVFIMQQLLTIAAHMDLSDEVGRCVKYSITEEQSGLLSED